MINKLLLVRVNDSDSKLLDQAGVTQFSKGDPIPVSPQAWHEEQGLSHYGYVLEGMKLKEYQELQKWADSHLSGGVSVHNYDKEEGIDEALSSVGLRINKSAE